MLEPEQAPVELLLRKSLLGEELINTQFHLFSSRSKSSGKVSKPRTLCANNILLTESAKYFLDLLSSTETVWDASVLAIAGQDIVPDGIPVCEYGYESDSDLDDEDYINVMLSFQAGDIEAPEDARCTIKPAPEDELESDEEGSEGLFMVERERPELSGASPAPWSEAQVPAVPVNPITARLKSIGSRHLFVKDTAFQTWYTFLSYLYTGQITFLPLKSSGKRSEGSSVGPGERPRCSAKSMYRLARKIGLDDLRDKALDFIRSNLTEDNILQEIACNFTSRYSAIMEMELDLLSEKSTSSPVLEGLPALVKRIASSELPRGANIIIGLHLRLLKRNYCVSFPLHFASTFISQDDEQQPRSSPDKKGDASAPPMKATKSGGGKKKKKW